MILETEHSNMQPLVSVLMTSYNREKYIGAAIESVMQSTYQHWELIITDDGSKDSTVAIARSYAAKDGRIKVFINENNLGDYPNRNKAASHASGKYLKYVDADDYIYPTGLQVLVSMMEANPEAGWGLCSLIQVVEQPYPVLLQPREAYLHNFFGPGLFHKAPLSSIIRKDVFEKVGGFKPLRMVGDFEMWHRLALDFPVLLMPDGVVWYREHGEQEVKDKRKFIQQYEQIRLEYLTNVKCPLNLNETKSIIASHRKNLFKEFAISLIKLRTNNAKDAYTLMKMYSPFTK